MAFDPATINILELPSVTLESREELPDISAIYFAYTNNAPIYIGKAARLAVRWRNHHRLFNLEQLSGVRIAWLAVDRIDLMETERVLISFFEPELNRSPVHNENKNLSLRSRLQLLIALENIKRVRADKPLLKLQEIADSIGVSRARLTAFASNRNGSFEKDVIIGLMRYFDLSSIDDLIKFD